MNLEQFKQLLDLLLNANLTDERGFIHIMLMAKETINVKLEKLQQIAETAIAEAGDIPSFGEDDKGVALTNMYSEHRTIINSIHSDMTKLGPEFNELEGKFTNLLHRLRNELTGGTSDGVDSIERGRLAGEFAEIGARVDVEIKRVTRSSMTLQALQEEVPKSESTSYTSAYLDLIR